MTTLNRFPLLGLWAEEAARRMGYSKAEAEALGHAYAVLYAIRAQRIAHPTTKEKEEKKSQRKLTRAQTLHFAGDDLEIARDTKGKILGLVGGQQPQTPQSYRTSVQKKFPPGYYDRLQKCFQQLLRNYTPSRLDSRVVYNLYDEWKKANAKGRLVDLDKLIDWCQQHAEDGVAKKGKRS